MPARRPARAAALASALVCALAAPALTQPTDPPQPPAPAESQPGAEPPPDPKSDPAPASADASAPDEEKEELETVLILTDGRRISGTLVSRDDERVMLRVNGIPTPFGADIVERVESLPPVAERYKSMRATIKDDDTVRLVLLAQWLIAYRRYELAAHELEGVLKTDAGNKDAQQLLTLCKEQIELLSRSKAAKPVKPEAGAPDRGKPRSGGASSTNEKFRAAVTERHTFPVLKNSDINIIRVYELDLRDPPRMVVPREAVDRMIEDYASDPLIPQTREGREALYRRPPAELVELMFNLKARELYPLVQVLDHPRAIKRFREDVHSTWLINACATSQCHGGTDAGRLMFASDRPNSDATVYTNLLILERFRTDDGKSLIDYDNPSRSPLLQAALPRDISLRPHPKVETPGRGWKPIFNSQDDRRFQDAVRWIQSMYLPRPEYPIEYKPRKPLTPEAANESGNSGPPR